MKPDINTREDIELLVNSFYEKVRNDDTIGYIFNDVAKVDWPHHLPTMYNFWESIIFGKATYRGNAMEPHIKLNKQEKLLPQHFQRWLQLFHSTIDEHFSGPHAEEARKRSQSIAQLMEFQVGRSGG